MSRVYRSGRRPLSQRVRFNRAGGIPDGDGDFSWTAEVLVDDPREPQLFATGILDPLGDPIIRVVTPVKLDKIGFDFSDIPAYAAAQAAQDQFDEVVAYTTESQLSVVQDAPGEGITHVHPDMLEDGE